jgi:hypothetical protein
MMRSTPGVLALSLLCVTVTMACSPIDDGGKSGAGGTSVTSSGTGTPSNDTGLLLDAGLGDGSVGDDCAASAKLIYVVTRDRQLYSFDPPALAFAKVGDVACANETSAFSMAVDRSGVAWMLFTSGKLYRVSTVDASCTVTPFVGGSVTFTHFGMGFVSDAPGSAAETLFISDYGGGGLGKIDTASLQITPIGQYAPPLGSSELTGTGDARLFGFFPLSPVKVAEIDKGTAKILSQVDLPGISIGLGYAFAFWGGDFWLFSGTEVNQYKPANGTATPVVAYPFAVVGAGVSTCAPLTPPP